MEPNPMCGDNGMSSSSAFSQEAVVFGLRARTAVREAHELHRLEARPVRAFQLADRVVDAAHRDERVPDQTVGRGCAVVLGQPRVVRLHHRHVGVAIGDLLEEPAGEHRREQQLGVEAVFVLLLEPLDAVAGPGGARAVVVEVALARELHHAAALQVLARVGEGHALHQPRVAPAVGEPDEAGRPVLELLGYVLHEVGRSLEVTVPGDDVVLAAHA